MASICADEFEIEWLDENDKPRPATPATTAAEPNVAVIAVPAKRKPPADDAATGKKRPIAVNNRMKGFRLLDLHKRLFGNRLPPLAHSAEADALTLLRCVCAKQAAFLARVDSEARLFGDVAPMVER